MNEPESETEFVNDDSGIDPEKDIVVDEEGAPVENAEQSDEPTLEEELVSEETLDPMEVLQKDADKWRDVAARAQADLENFRKRMAREKSDAIQFANSSLLQSLLPVIDNFEMGLKMAANENQDSMIFKGMEMVQKQLVDFLTDNHVEILESEGQPFDPNIHEALKQEPNEEVPENHIIFEMRRGYKLRDRLLRAANVVVSTGPDTGEGDSENEDAEAAPEAAE